jgi:hypothetical protein
MSVGTLLSPETESQPWASLYANNLTTEGFQLTPGAALGKVLTSNALGVASWQVPSIPMNDSAIWRPGMPSSPPFVNLWSEVVFAIGQGVRNVYVDTRFSPAVITSVGMPVGGWNMLGVTFYSLSSNFAVRSTLNIDPTAILVDVIGFSGFFQLNLSSTVPTFAFTNNQAIIFSLNCQVNMTAGTTSSPIVLNDLFVAVGFEMSSTLVNDVLVPFIHMTNGSSCVVDTVFNTMSPSPFYSGPLIDGDGSGNTFLFIYDASNPPFTTALPGDTVISHPIDAAGSVSYDDTLVPPTTGATTVQAALDYFKVNGDTVYPLLAPTGTAGAPAYSFSGSTSSGMWLSTGPDTINFDVDGTTLYQIYGGGTPQTFSPAGLASTPGISFLNAPGDGMWVAPNQLNISHNASTVLTFDNGVAQVTLAPGYDLNLSSNNISGASAITAFPGVNMNFIDGSSSEQMQIPSVGNQVVIVNQLTLPQGARYYQQINNGAANILVIDDNLGAATLTNQNTSGSPFVLNADASPTVGPLQLQCQGTTMVQVGTAGLPDSVGFFGATPVEQPTDVIVPATYASVGGTPVLTNDTFNGYTIGQIVSSLQALGLLQ